MAQLQQQIREPPGYWWQDTYPELLRSGRAAELGMLEAVQGPGDTIYVPQGWHHCVSNLEWTVAATQNLLMPAMMPERCGRSSQPTSRASRAALRAVCDATDPR